MFNRTAFWRWYQLLHSGSIILHRSRERSQYLTLTQLDGVGIGAFSDLVERNIHC